MQHLQHRVSVITGAANGIGKELAEQCASYGMHLVLADVEEKELSAVAAGITALRPNSTIVCVVGDASTVAGVDRLLQATTNQFGPKPDIALLFNNIGVQGAGIAAVGRDTSTLADWDYMFSVNVLSILRSTRAFVPLLMKQTLPSHIINTASMAGLSAAAASYGVTKRAAVALSEAIDCDLRAKSELVRCSVLTPAFVHTNFHRIQRIEDALRGPAARKLPAYYGPNTLKMLHSRGSIPVKDCVDAVFAALQADLFYIIPPGHQPFANMMVTHLSKATLSGKSPGGLAPIIPKRKKEKKEKKAHSKL